MSPAIRRIISDLKKMESVAKGFGASFSGVSKAAFSSLDGMTRASKSAADQMRGLSNVADRATRSYQSAWLKADQDRERSAGRMYVSSLPPA
jgi:hypothetical protein